MTDSARLSGKAAAANVDYNVELARGARLFKRLIDYRKEVISHGFKIYQKESSVLGHRPS